MGVGVVVVAIYTVEVDWYIINIFLVFFMFPFMRLSFAHVTLDFMQPTWNI